MPSREQICSQQIHCLSCPISVAVTGKDCRELTQQELIRIKEELIMTDTDMLYMASLEKRNTDLEAKVAELEAKHHNECAQIAHYSDELRRAKELLRDALPILHRAFFANYKDTNAANELYDKIRKVVGGADDDN